MQPPLYAILTWRPRGGLINQMSQGIALCLAGLAVGVLMGLSTTPIVATVISASLTVVLAAVSVLAGIERRGARLLHIDMWPVTILFIAVLCGAAAGVRARSENLLAPSPREVINDWQQFGLDDGEIARRLFESAYPAQAGIGPAPTAGVLFRSPAVTKACAGLTGAGSTDQQRQILDRLTDPYWARVRELVSTQPNDYLENTIRAICLEER